MQRVRHRWFIAVVLAGIVASGCSASDGSAPTQPGGASTPGGTGRSTIANAYVSSIIGVMATNSINRFTINWTTFQAQVYGAAENAQTIADTYPAIRVALTLLGDGHSSYTAASGQVFFVPTRTCTASGAPTPTVPANVGYVRVGSFVGSGTAATTFANGIQATIRANDRSDLVGWIVDLRGNGGGNMWPMVAGLGPIIGEGVLGFFVDPLGARSVWEYRAGASWSGGFVAQQVDQPYQLLRSLPKVAVLTDNGVASSGEATAIAFRGRTNTRTFGVATCGLSTSNRGFPLSDGANLNLTVSTMADRTGFAYGGQLQPDEVIADQAAVVQRAIAWLLAP